MIFVMPFIYKSQQNKSGVDLSWPPNRPMQKNIQEGLARPYFFPKLSPAVWITLCYLLFSILWILLSDSLASQLAGHNEAFFQQIQVFKGLVFVLLSGLLLFGFSQKLYSNIRVTSLQKEKVAEKFYALNETIREGVFDYDFVQDKAVLNDKAMLFFPGHSNKMEHFWDKFQSRIHPDDVEKQLAEYEAICREGKQSWKTEYRMLGTDNRYHVVMCHVYMLRHPGETKPFRCIGAIQDVSDLRKLQAEKHEQQLKHKRTLAASIIRAQENERNRWAEELHDNVCQILAVASLYAGDICAKPGQAKRVGPELKKLLSDSIREIRQLSAQIKKPSFDDTSLLQSIYQLIANIRRVNDVRFDVDGAKLNESKLCDEQKLMIFRIVQEQLNNIIKYAEASQVHIQLDNEKEQVMVTVKDDGKGFDTTQVKTGIGLRNLQSRLQVYGGQLHIESAPGKGCSLQASFKIKYDKE